VVLAVLLPIAAINIHVDPYHLLGRNTLGIYVFNERLAKPALIQNASHDAIVIGSSKVTSIDPADITRAHVFNAAFGAALPEEMAWFLQRYAKSGQTVLLGLDFYMFNERAFPLIEKDIFAADTRPSRLAYIFDKDIFKVSLDALYLHYIKHQEPLLLSSGMRNQSKDRAQDTALGGNYDYERVLKTLRENHYHDVHYSDRRLEILRRLKTTMAERGVKFLVFINPLNVAVRALIRELAEQDFQRFRQDVRAILPDIYDLTGEEFESRDFYYRHDPYHYTTLTGGCFINHILAGQHPVAPPRSPASC
jgi:hypothetical protein